MFRSVDELVDVDDPAWDEITSRIPGATHDVTVLPSDPATCRRTLHMLQVTAHSTLGAVALNSGGMLIDHGWIRVLGGTPRPGVPDIVTASGVAADVQDPAAIAGVPGLLVAYDVLGGQFAIDAGGLASAPGRMCYWSPDCLEWESLGLGHTDFVEWLLNGNHNQFYDGFRWEGWNTQTEALPTDEGYSVFPFFFLAEYDVKTAVRKPVPITELVNIHAGLATEMGTGRAPFTWG
ncbi:MAG: DUF2625 domain-containing protein [Micrococcales bacterium]|nr:DUF2625 domain-containing protein [Micrococcales bacterium]MCL2666770.1 DUF2625 domain-containing protein [Micrococcales bacterium]